MRVLHVDTALEWRGGQQQLAYLLAARPQDGWAGVPDSPLAQRVGPPTLPLYANADPRSILKLIRPDFDIVAAHTPHAAGLAWLCGRPLVIHRRTDFVPNHPWKYRRADRIVCVSDHIRRVMIGAGLPAEKLVVVYSGVRSRAGGKNILDFPRPIWGAIGALVPHKGHADLLRALVALPGTAVIAGSGPLAEPLQVLAAQLGVSDRTRFLGHREDVEDLLASFDVLVHPSVEEGLGQVLAEALEAGSRVVACRAGGIPEVVGEGGVLVPPGQPGLLAEGMRKALELPPGYGTEQGRRFSVEAMVRGTEAIYREVLDLRAVKGL